MRRAALASGGVASALLLVLVLAGRPHAPRTPVTTFADGSIATPVGDDAELRVVTSEPSLIVSELVRGTYRFKVTKDPARTFRVQSGAVRVEVLGTQFVVERVSAERARVSVTEGRVRVAGEVEQHELTAGDSVLFPAVTLPSSLTVADSAPAEDAPSPAPAAAPAHPAPKRMWIRLAQAGDYDAAYSALLSTHDTARDAAELMLQADTARLSHHPDAAVAPLRLVLARHAADPRAPLAAFTLGRVLLDDLGRPREAGEAFARARHLAPRGPLAEDALAREVEAWSRSGDLTRAHELAETYVGQYPSGTRVRLVRRFGDLK
jgi:transmembrane sensor